MLHDSSKQKRICLPIYFRKIPTNSHHVSRTVSVRICLTLSASLSSWLNPQEPKDIVMAVAMIVYIVWPTLSPFPGLGPPLGLAASSSSSKDGAVHESHYPPAISPGNTGIMLSSGAKWWGRAVCSYIPPCPQGRGRQLPPWHHLPSPGTCRKLQEPYGEEGIEPGLGE